MAQNNPVKREVVLVIPKGDDLELHVTVIDVEGVNAVDIRDFVPSMQRYGRNGLIPMTAVAAVAKALGGL